MVNSATAFAKGCCPDLHHETRRLLAFLESEYLQDKSSPRAKVVHSQGLLWFVVKSRGLGRLNVRCNGGQKRTCSQKTHRTHRNEPEIVAKIRKITAILTGQIYSRHLHLKHSKASKRQ